MLDNQPLPWIPLSLCGWGCPYMLYILFSLVVHKWEYNVIYKAQRHITIRAGMHLYLHVRLWIKMDPRVSEEQLWNSEWAASILPVPDCAEHKGVGQVRSWDFAACRFVAIICSAACQSKQHARNNTELKTIIKLRWMSYVKLHPATYGCYEDWNHLFFISVVILDILGVYPKEFSKLESFSF